MTAAASAVRWMVWLIRWPLFAAYGLLLFAAKPGSRLILPALAAAAGYLWRQPLDAMIAGQLTAADWQRLPDPQAFHALMTAGGLLAVCVFVTVYSVRDLLRPVAQVTALLMLLALVLAVALGYRATDVPFDALSRTDWKQAALSALPDALLASGVALATCVYVTLSCLLALLLGAFPPMVRPLRPLRTLKARNRVIRPVAVRVAVPKLPRRSPARTAGAMPGE